MGNNYALQIKKNETTNICFDICGSIETRISHRFKIRVTDTFRNINLFAGYLSTLRAVRKNICDQK